MQKILTLLCLSVLLNTLSILPANAQHLSNAVLNTPAVDRQLHKEVKWVVIQTGEVSWYGWQFQGSPTSYYGYKLPLDNRRHMCAHRSLPVGTWIKITNLRNGLSTKCQILDRGPWVAGRIVDMTYIAAKELHMLSSGITEASISIEAPP